MTTSATAGGNGWPPRPAQGPATQKLARSPAPSEDIECLFVRCRFGGAVIGVALQALQVFALDPLLDAAAAFGQQCAIGGHRNLDHAFGRFVRSERAIAQRLAAVC